MEDLITKLATSVQKLANKLGEMETRIDQIEAKKNPRTTRKAKAEPEATDESKQ